MIKLDLPKPETIARYCIKIPPRQIQKPHSAELRARVLAYLRAGHGPVETAKHFDLPRCTVSKWCRVEGIKFARGNFKQARLAAA